MRVNASCKCEMLLLHRMRLDEIMRKVIGGLVDYSINPSETEEKFLIGTGRSCTPPKGGHISLFVIYRPWLLCFDGDVASPFCEGDGRNLISGFMICQRLPAKTSSSTVKPDQTETARQGWRIRGIHKDRDVG
jgi:hypothetical protein